MGYKPRQKKATATVALIPTQGYVMMRASGCIEIMGNKEYESRQLNAQRHAPCHSRLPIQTRLCSRLVAYETGEKENESGCPMAFWAMLVAEIIGAAYLLIRAAY